MVLDSGIFDELVNGGRVEIDTGLGIYGLVETGSGLGKTVGMLTGCGTGGGGIGSVKGDALDFLGDDSIDSLVPSSAIEPGLNPPASRL